MIWINSIVLIQKITNTTDFKVQAPYMTVRSYLTKEEVLSPKRSN